MIEGLTSLENTIFSLCLSVYNEAVAEEHLGPPVRLKKAIGELKRHIISQTYKTPWQKDNSDGTRS
jgi:hypothetical protein